MGSLVARASVPEGRSAWILTGRTRALGRACVFSLPLPSAVGVAFWLGGGLSTLPWLAEPGSGRWRQLRPAGKVQVSGLPGRLQ